MVSQRELSQQLGEALQRHKAVMTTAESCTGGGVATAMTDIAGSSAWFDRAFVTYSNEAKMEMLSVKPETLESYGAVSEPVVIEMVSGALQHSLASIDELNPNEPFVVSYLFKPGPTLISFHGLKLFFFSETFILLL